MYAMQCNLMLRHKTMAHIFSYQDISAGKKGTHIAKQQKKQQQHTKIERQTRLKNTVEIMKKIFHLFPAFFFVNFLFPELTEMICRGEKLFSTLCTWECHSN